PKAWSPGTKGAVRGDVVYMDVKTEADLDKYRGKLKGAIVLIDGPREVKPHTEAQSHRETDEELLKLADDIGPGEGQRLRPTPEQGAAQELKMKKGQLAYWEGAAVVVEPGRGDGGTLFVQSAPYPHPFDIPREKRVRVYAPDAPPIIPQVVVAVEHYN